MTFDPIRFVGRVRTHAVLMEGQAQQELAALQQEAQAASQVFQRKLVLAGPSAEKAKFATLLEEEANQPHETEH